MSTESEQVHSIEKDLGDNVFSYKENFQSVVDPAFQPDQQHSLTVSAAVLTIISTIVGGGIVGLPYAFYELGIYFGLLMMLLVAI